MTNAFVVVNPVAGSNSGIVERELPRYFRDVGWTWQIYSTTGDELVAEVVRDALEGDHPPFDLIVAAGGDGTVSGVAAGVSRSGVPMGVLPVGTGNTLARELGVPLTVEGALELLTGDHSVRDIDGMAVGERIFVLNVSVGISGLTMRDTATGEKRRLGRAAYVWTGLRKLFGYQPHRFALTIDGQSRSVRASEIAVVNSGALGDPALRWSPEAELDDGRIDVLIVRARTIIDYLGLALAILLRRHSEEPSIEHATATQRVSVDADPDLPVQADGEVIGTPPVTVTVVPGAVRVVTPASDAEQ